MKYFFLSVFILLQISISAEYRVALLLENKNYKNHPIKYSSDQFQKIEDKLKKDGFSTTVWKDISKNDFYKKLEEFVSVTPVNSTLLIYYSGYLLSSDDKGLSKNFLLSTESEYKSDGDISRRSIRLETLIETLRKRCGSKDKIIYLDILTKYPNANIKEASSLVNTKLPENVHIFSNTKPGQNSETYNSTLINYSEKSPTPVIEKLKKISVWSSVKEALPKRDPNFSKAIFPPDQLGNGQKAGQEWVNSLGMVFCWCPPGKYLMGSPKNADWFQEDQFQKEVEIKKGLWVSKYELTNLQYYKLRKRESDHFKVNLPNHPIISSFDEKKHLLKYLQEKYPAPKGWYYSLPYETEWEYFARAGSKEQFFFGSDISQLPNYANFADKSLFNLKDSFYNYADSSLDDGTPKIAEVGSYLPNPWGIHDVYGNVWEWCNTRYIRRGVKEKQNGIVARGGGWCSKKEYCHSSFKNAFEGRFESNFLGVRLVLKKK